MFHKHFDTTLSRVQAFLGASAQLKSKLYKCASAVRVFRRKDPAFPRPVSFSEATADPSAFELCEPFAGTQLGPVWSTRWFRIEIDSLPSSSSSSSAEVHLRWDSGSEALLWSADGLPLDSFTGTTDDTQRDAHVLKNADVGALPLVFFCEAACCEMFGNSTGWECGPDPPQAKRDFVCKRCEVAVFDREAAGLFWDLQCLHDIAKELKDTSQVAATCLWAADEAINACFLDRPETFRRAREITAACFERLRAAASSSLHTIFAVGNCHIDTAWLWPYRETRRKCARSWAAQLRLTEQYPEYRFALSQAQQLEWLAQDYPRLFAQVKRAVSEGRFLPVGGTWVEMDCNLPSGESLVRQFLLGQKFFAEHFGKPCDVFWLPDTFGYASQLPQIMRQCGIAHFVTQKLSWNQWNKFEYTTFRWEGLDGSSVVTHFPPSESYVARIETPQIRKSETNHRDKERSPESLMLFGHGDGGGGPQVAMLERLERLSHIPTLPVVKQSTPSEFFATVDSHANRLLPWKGELYFELHRGTYTTQAKNKQRNRKAEALLHDVELLSSMAALGGGAFSYPAEELQRLWKLVLLNQFHDVIPGSSIEMVYEDSSEHYNDVEASGAALLVKAADAILPAEATRPRIFNTLEWTRTSVVQLLDDAASDESVLQRTATGKPLALVTVPGFSALAVGLDAARPVVGVACNARTIEDGRFVVLENEFLLAKLCTASAALVSLVHKQTGRDSILQGGVGNRLALFEDLPNYWDAWDVDIFHLEKEVPLQKACTTEIIEQGPLRSCVVFKIKLTDGCTIEQKVILTAVSKRLDFDTQVDWHEAHRFLKVDFALNVRALAATYETQFGHLERPSHMNTRMDMAKFEVCAHRWADMSEFGFGVSLLNDSKYGHAALGNTLRLSLLRSPKAPDAHADMGAHRFVYSLFPHAGSFQTGGTIQEAADLNVPLLVFPPSPAGKATAAVLPSFLAIEGGHGGVVIEAVKLDEAEHNSIIVRVCERFGGSCTCALHSPARIPIKSIVPVDLLEQPIASLPAVASDRISFSLTPFQLRSFKFVLLGKV